MPGGLIPSKNRVQYVIWFRAGVTPVMKLVRVGVHTGAEA